MEADPDDLELTVLRDAGEVTIALAGALDHTTVDRLSAEADAHPGEPLVLDLRRLTFLDSSGLRVLLALRRGTDLKLVPGPKHVQDVFELTETRSLFSWRDY